MNVLVQGAPNPVKRPQGYVAFPKQHTRFLQLTGADYRYILEKPFPGDYDEKIITAVDHIKPECDQSREGKLYAWAIPEFINNFWKQFLTVLEEQKKKKDETSRL